MKTKYIVLLIFFGAIFLMRVDWDKLENPEYRQLATYSEAQQEIFKQRLLKNMATESTIYLRDLTDFEWDTVCAMEGYSRLREDLGRKNYYGKDLPELEFFPNVRESEYAFVFIKSGVAIAVINQFEPLVVSAFDLCANASGGLLKLIAPVTYKSNEGLLCKDNKGPQCQLEFYGGKS